MQKYIGEYEGRVMFNDEAIEKYYGRIQELIDNAHKNNKTVALWGIGNRGKAIAEQFDLYASARFDYVIDENNNLD